MGYLDELENRYSNGDPGFSYIANFHDRYNYYLSRRKAVIADLSVIALGLSYDIISQSDPDGLAVQAMEMTNPNFDISRLDDYGPAELQGIINSSKGKYFELLVVEKLNSGENLGDFALPEGYRAELASSMTQPGWDILIVDENGLTSDYLQLKATSSTSYIQESLERYPELRILATEEIEGQDEVIIQSNISNQELTDEIERTLAHKDASLVDEFLEGFNPLLPLTFIFASQGYRIAAKKSTVRRAVMEGKERLVKSIAISGIGASAFAAGMGWFTLPITLGSGAIINELNVFNNFKEYFKTARNELKVFDDYRNIKLIENGLF